MSGSLKKFLDAHSYTVDLVAASLLICLCLIVLLPKVHDSFEEPPPIDQDESTGGVPLPPPPTIGAHQDNHQDYHHHHHKLPVGEAIICAGFFVFYCIGMAVQRSHSTGDTGEESHLLLAGERRISTNCCSSARCPEPTLGSVPSTSTGVSGPSGGSLAALNSHEAMLEGAQVLRAGRQVGELANEHGENNDDDESCVLLLNRHHTHHSHTRHEHQHAHANEATTATLSRRAERNRKLASYGSLPAETVYVEEIRITRPPVGKTKQSWSVAGKVAVFGFVLAALLILFDFNTHGLIEVVKVFRAASTGALLYVAFFIVLPRRPVGCNSCVDEEELIVMAAAATTTTTTTRPEQQVY